MKTDGYNSLTSWLTLMVCFLIQFFIMSVMRLSGLFFVILFDGYNTDREKASVPIIVFGVLRTLTGPFTAFLGELFGFRAVILTGCILCALGVGSCFFAETIIAATVSLGFIYGLGLAFGHTLMPTILKQHFTKHINLVNGICLTGPCMGAVIMSPVVTSLQQSYGMQGMFLILGGIFLNCVPAAILLKHPHNDRRKSNSVDNNAANKSQKTIAYHENPSFTSDEENPREEYKILQTSIEKKNNELQFSVLNMVADNNSKNPNRIKKNSKGNCENSALMHIENVSQYTLHKTLSKSQMVFSTSPDIKLIGYIEKQGSIKKFSVENSYFSKVSQPVNVKTAKPSKIQMICKSFALFTDPTFHCIMLSQSLGAFVTTLNWTIIVDYARDKGMSTEVSAHFAMFLPISEIAGNMCLNWVTDCHIMTRTNFSLTCFLILVLDAGYIIWTYEFVFMMIGVLIFGFVTGAVYTTFPGIVIEFIKEEQQNMALASRFCLHAFFNLLKAPIIGYFRGTLGSYDWVYCIIMVCSFICCILVKLTPVLATCRNRKRPIENS